MTIFENEFKKALTIFSETVTVMSFSSDQPENSSFSTHQEERSRCLSKFTVLKEIWNRDKSIIEEIEKLLIVTISSYSINDFDKGDFAVKKIDEIIYTIRYMR